MSDLLRSRLLGPGVARLFAPADALGALDLLARTAGLVVPSREGAVAADALVARLESAAGRGEAAAVVAARGDGRIVGLATLELEAALARVGLVALDAEAGAAAALLLEGIVGAARRAGARRVAWEAGEGGGGAALARAAAEAAARAATPGLRFTAPRLALDPGAPAWRLGCALTVTEVVTGPKDAPPLLAAPVDAAVEGARRLGLVRVREVGRGALDEVEGLARELLSGRLAQVEARVPLGVPAGTELAAALEARGFLPAGSDASPEGAPEAVLLRFAAPVPDPRACASLSAAVEALPAPEREAVRALASRLGEALAARSAAAAPAAPPPPPLPPLEMIEFARLAGQRQLVSGLSHEVNNPLNIILGTTYVLRSRLREGRDGLADDVAPQLASIEEEVARIARVVEGLRRFAHPEEGARGAVDVAAAVDDALALVEAEARCLGIEVARESAPGLPPVAGSRAELAQVVFQLVRNAVEASSEGRSVSVAAEPRPGGDGARIVVRDRGRGIAPEDLRRVFDPFFTTKSAAAGAGLGLAIARTVVESHGGRIRLESRPGEGTTAVIELPAARAGAPREEGTARAEARVR
jgi:signal transduction histidine kinase